MRIALAQIISTPDPEANLGLVDSYAERAADKGAGLVVFPEATMSCFGRPLDEIAEPLEGPWATRVREIAAARRVTIAAGMFTPGHGGRVSNTLLVTGPQVEASYDKIHLFDAFAFNESDAVAAGEKPVVVDIADVRVGLTTCYDVRFPALYTHLAREGAQVILVCASWGAGPGKSEQWDLLTRTRALDSTTFVVACGQGDPATNGVEVQGTSPTGIGHSLVVSPWGDVIASIGEAAGLLVADIDLDEVARARTAIPVLANARL
jgi:predicted amidohydrolase